MNRARRLTGALAAAAVIAAAGAAVLLISNARSIAEWILIPLVTVMVLKALDLIFSPIVALCVAIFAFGLLLGRLWEAGATAHANHHE